MKGQVEQLNEVDLNIIPVNEDRQGVKSLETKGGGTFTCSDSVFEHDTQKDSRTPVTVRADAQPEGTPT